MRGLRKQPVPANGRCLLGRGQLLWVSLRLLCWWFSGRVHSRWLRLAFAHMHFGSPSADTSALAAPAFSTAAIKVVFTFAVSVAIF